MPSQSKSPSSPRSAASVIALLDKYAVKPLSSSELERKRRYLRAAAVLVALEDPDALQPVGSSGPPGEGARLLSAELIPATGRKFAGKVMLHPDARRAAIREMPTINSRKEALRANLKERVGDLQTDFEKYLLGEAPPLERQNAEELEHTVQIVGWLEGILETLPDANAVRKLAEYHALMAPFESLAGDDVFRGRRAELDDLRSFVGVLAPEALLKSILAKAFSWIRLVRAPALSISGPGGIGKSALIARFMLEHTRLPLAARIPFAYLDFDRPTVNISHPLALVAEMVRQVDLQFAQEGFFRGLWEFMVSRTRDWQIGSSDTNRRDNESKSHSVIQDLGGILATRLGQRPFVVVLDTFEEVQYRGENSAFAFWEILDALQARQPFLRIVVSGRAAVSSLRLNGKPPEIMELGDLDYEASLAFVRSQGVMDTTLAAALVKQVGGVPLSLKLAASVAERDETDSKGITGLESKSRFWFNAVDEVIQGTLYARILGHLHDPALERLAHPGLVLRRISPASILNVLNVPCHLGIKDLQQAESLFHKLRDETALVASDTVDGSLVHRTDLRRTMLKLLLEKSPAQAEEIHRSAVNWYATQSGWRAKAEELYHRLQLGDTDRDSGYEHPEIFSSLQASIAEFPVAAQRFLASLGYKVSAEVLKDAGNAELEAITAAEVENYLPFGHRSVQHAHELLLELNSHEHQGPAILRAAARIAAQQENVSQARDLIERGLTAAIQTQSLRDILNLLSDQAWLHRKGQNPILPGSLQRLGEYARRQNSVAFMLQYRIQAFELSRSQSESSGRELDRMARGISELLIYINPIELWNLFPVFSLLSSKLFDFAPISARLFKLIIHPEAPFGRVAFEDMPARESLYHLLEQIARVRDLDAVHTRERTFISCVNAFEDLSAKWPFRVLWVKPPYAQDSYSSESAPA